jgi:hypothetical protein
MNNAIIFIFAALYNLTILGGTAYLVAEHNWSPWWFLMTVMLLASSSDKSKEKEDE